MQERKRDLELAFNAAGIPFQPHELFKSTGPDIVASSGAELWRFECKGMGEGTPQTQKNNFDRAVASVVSYYESSDLRLGLALASGYLLEYRFGNRLPVALRKALNLWVFVVENHTVGPFEPDFDPLPYIGAW